MHKQTGLFVNINYLVLFLLAWQYTCCAMVNEMLHLHCFFVMSMPTTTPISSTTPINSHLLRVSRDLLASAAASRPKTSAKQSWSQKKKKRERYFVIRQCLGFLASTLKEYYTRNLKLWPKIFTLLHKNKCRCILSY